MESLGFIVELVKTKKKLHAMKTIYKKFDVPKEGRADYRALWDMIKKDLEV